MLPLDADANSRWQERRVHGLMSILLYSPCGRTLLPLSGSEPRPGLGLGLAISASALPADDSSSFVRRVQSLLLHYPVPASGTQNRRHTTCASQRYQSPWLILLLTFGTPPLP